MRSEVVSDILESILRVFYDKNALDNFAEPLSYFLAAITNSIGKKEIYIKQFTSLYFGNKFLAQIQRTLAPFVSFKEFLTQDGNLPLEFSINHRLQAMTYIASLVSLHYSSTNIALIPHLDQLKSAIKAVRKDSPEIFLPLLALTLKTDDSFFFKAIRRSLRTRFTRKTF
jgi:hypothetical protein